MDLPRRRPGSSAVLVAVAAASMGAALLVPSAFRPEGDQATHTTTAVLKAEEAAPATGSRRP